MRFEYTRKQIEEIAKEQHYTLTNVEKVIRLSLVLHDLNTLPAFQGMFLLKGGTGINLLAFEQLPRLSVDLDLDLATNLPKEVMLTVRERMNESFIRYFEENGYKLESRKSYTLDSYSLHYTTVTGSNDKIKLDINYLSRCHILENKISKINFPFCYSEKKLTVAHSDIIELYAGKIKAFYERCKPRDIYDIYSLANSSILATEEEKTLLRKCIVFYSTMGNEDNPEILEKDAIRILQIPFREIKTQLLPMLHTHAGKYEKDKINQTVVDFINNLMTLDESDKEYISDFYKGIYRPELLFDEAIALKLKKHPAAIRTQQNIQRKMEKS